MRVTPEAIVSAVVEAYGSVLRTVAVEVIAPVEAMVNCPVVPKYDVDDAMSPFVNQIGVEVEFAAAP